MLKVFPIQEKSEQEALCARCGIPFEAELLAYQATVDEVFVGVCLRQVRPWGSDHLPVRVPPTLGPHAWCRQGGPLT